MRTTPFALHRCVMALGKIDMYPAWAIPTLIGCFIVIVGCAVEANGQYDLLRTAGLDAYNAYRTFHSAAPMPFFDWMQRGMAGTLTTFGGNIQARGFVCAIFGPAISMLTIISCRFRSKINTQRIALKPAPVR